MNKRETVQALMDSIQKGDFTLQLMRTVMSQTNLYARAYHRILKLARTIADLAGSEEI